MLKFGVCRSTTAKLLAVKVGGLKKKSAGRPWPHSNQSAWVRVLAWSNHSQSLMAGDFAALWPTDSKFLATKDLNLLKKHTKNQMASSVLEVVFALSKSPHLHRELSNRPGMVVRHCICIQKPWKLLKVSYSPYCMYSSKRSDSTWDLHTSALSNLQPYQ